MIVRKSVFSRFLRRLTHAEQHPAGPDREAMHKVPDAETEEQPSKRHNEPERVPYLGPSLK